MIITPNRQWVFFPFLSIWNLSQLENAQLTNRIYSVKNDGSVFLHLYHIVSSSKRKSWGIQNFDLVAVVDPVQVVHQFSSPLLHPS